MVCTRVSTHSTFKWISRLNFEIRNRHNFLFFFNSKNWNWFSQSCWFWRYQIFGPLPWEFDFEIFQEFLKMRGWCSFAWAFSANYISINLNWLNLQVYLTTQFNPVKQLLQTPTQKIKSGFSMFSSQGIGSSLLSLEMILKKLYNGWSQT